MASKKAKKGKHAGRQATGASSKSVSSTVVRQPLEQNQLHSGTGPVLEAKSLYEGGKIVEALRLCLAILQEQGPNPEILELAGRAAYANGQTAAAISLLEKALALDAKRVPTLELLLEVAGEAGDKDRVKRIAEALSRLRSGDSQSSADPGEEEALPAAELAVKTEKSEQVPEVLTKIFGLTSRLRVVDIGSNPIDGTPPYADLLKAGAVDLVGFVPQRDALAKLNKTKGPHEIYYPHAVGDGKPATLYLCRASGMTSTLKPNFALLNHFHGYPQWAEVVGTETVLTVRLDDLEEVGSIDWLKIDIQGGELRVFEHGERRLADTLVIQTEVNFVPLYEGQPLFADIDAWMRAHGFMLHALLEQRKRLYAPLQVNNQIHNGLNQLTTADAVYVPKLERLQTLSVDQLGKLASILHVAYGSADLALRVLMIRDVKTGGAAAKQLLTSMGISQEQAEAVICEARRGLERDLQGTSAEELDHAPKRTVALTAKLGRLLQAKPATALEAHHVSERVFANITGAQDALSRHEAAAAAPYLERAWMLKGPDTRLVAPLLQMYLSQGRLHDAAAAVYSLAVSCYESGDITHFAEAVARYHGLVIQLNHSGQVKALHDPVLTRCAEKLFAPLRKPLPAPAVEPRSRLRVAYVIPLETERNSTLTALPVELAEWHDQDRFEVEFFSVYRTETTTAANPEFATVLERIRRGGWPFHEGGNKIGVLAQAQDLADRIRQRDCDVVVFSIQIGVHWLAALLRPAPVVLGVDYGHPQWYTSSALDYAICSTIHGRMEALCPVLPWTGIAGNIRHTGAAETPLARDALGLRPESIVLVSSGSRAKFKDPRFWAVINTVLCLRPQCEWLIVGITAAEVPEGCLSAEVADRVTFLGWRADFDRCIAAGDIYVDTFPVGGGFATAPAVEARIPCVTARHDCSAVFNKAMHYSPLGMQIEDETLLAERDPEKMAELALKLVDDPDLRQSFARAQQQKLAPLFDTRARISELEEIYEAVVESRSVR